MTPGGGAKYLPGIAYGSEHRQRLDVWVPESVASYPKQARAPVVVFFYGGSWRSGEREAYGFVGKALAARGIVSVLADYRLYPEVRYPDFLSDSAAAVAWTFREIDSLGGDSSKIFLMGHSAGAYNTAMLALDPTWLSAEGVDRARLNGWIGLAGPYDFLPIVNPDVKPVFFHPAYPPGTQPIDHVGPGAPPTFLGAASEDALVDPQRNSKALAKALRDVDVSVVLRTYPRASHVTLIGAFAGPLRYFGAVLDDTVAFIEERANKRPVP